MIKLKNISEIPGIDGKCPVGHQKKQILTTVLENWKKSVVKHSIGKPILLNLINLLNFFSG